MEKSLKIRSRFLRKNEQFSVKSKQRWIILPIYFIKPQREDADFDFLGNFGPGFSINSNRGGRDGSNLYLIWSAWFDLKIYLVPSFAWFGLIWRFKYLGLIWLEQFENCKCLTWLGLVFKYLKKAWAWSFDFLKGLIWLEKYKPESNLQPRIIITEKLWIFYFCILLDVILRSICNFNTSFFN